MQHKNAEQSVLYPGYNARIEKCQPPEMMFLFTYYAVKIDLNRVKIQLNISKETINKFIVFLVTGSVDRDANFGF